MSDAAPLALQLPALSFAHRSSSGALSDLRWVDLEESEGDDARWCHRLRGGERLLRQGMTPRHLPPPVAEAAREAASRGQATAWDALRLLFARPEWLVAARRHAWAPWSPAPALLASLLESFAIDPELHAFDPEVLANLAALASRWHPRRGQLSQAREVLGCAGRESELDAVAVEGRAPAPAAERFVCRSADALLARRVAPEAVSYQVHQGFLCQRVRGEGLEIGEEDLALDPHVDAELPRHLLRLLPVWTTPRVLAPDLPTIRPAPLADKRTSGRAGAVVVQVLSPPPAGASSPDGAVEALSSAATQAPVAVAVAPPRAGEEP